MTPYDAAAMAREYAIACGAKNQHAAKPALAPLCAECVVELTTAAHAAGVASMQPWKDAVIDATVVSWTYQKEHETDPRAAINAALAWTTQVALDPAVSEGAQELYDKGKAAGVTDAHERLGALIRRLSCAHYLSPGIAAAQNEVASLLRDGPTS